MASRSSRLRRLVLDGLTLLLVLAFLVAIAEGLFRLLFDDASLPRPPSAEIPSADPGLPRLHLEQDFAQPGIRGLTAGALYEANRYGFRGPERSREKPPRVVRVAIVGDSTAMGWGVEEEDTYAAQLEDRLAASDRPGETQVLNLAIAGLNSEGVVRRIEKLGVGFEPDIVVYGYSINDIDGPAYRHSLDREYAASLFRHDSPSQIWRWLRPRWLAFRELVFTPRGTFAFELDENYFRNPEAWNAVRRSFERLAELGRENGFCSVLLIHTQMQALNALHPYERHYEAIAETARQSGLVPIETLGRFREEEASKLWVNHADRHANVRGHAIFAEVLAEGLDALPPECWGGETPVEGVD